MIKFSLLQEDDPQFIEKINNIVNGLLCNRCPQEVYIVCVDNWFGSKWVGFSGKSDGYQIRKQQMRMTLPPFNPRRIYSEDYYRLNNNEYILDGIGHKLHIQQKSSCNLQRRLWQLSSSAVFVWYSSNTIKNGIGSLMVYWIEGEKNGHWYCSIERNTNWLATQTKHTTFPKLQELEEEGSSLFTTLK